MRKSRNKIDINETGTPRRIKEVRRAHCRNAGEFAAAIKFPRSTVSEIETGSVKPSLEFLYAFSEKTKVNIHWILTGRGPKYLNGDVIVAEEEISYQPQAELMETIAEKVRRMDELRRRDVLRYIETQLLLDELLRQRQSAGNDNAE